MIISHLDPWSSMRSNPGGLYGRLQFAWKQLQQSKATRANARRAMGDLLHVVLTELGIVADHEDLDNPEATLDKYEERLSVNVPWGQYIQWMADNLGREQGTPDYVGKLLTPGALAWIVEYLAGKKKAGGGPISLREVVEARPAAESVTPGTKPPNRDQWYIIF